MEWVSDLSVASSILHICNYWDSVKSVSQKLEFIEKIRAQYLFKMNCQFKLQAVGFLTDEGFYIPFN